MLVERQIKEFIESTFSEEVIRQIPTDFDGRNGLLSLHLHLDLSKTLRKNNEIGLFIISNYPAFVRIAEDSISDILKTKGNLMLQFGLNLSFYFQNCPLPKHNIESAQFLSAAFQNPQGVVIFLKDAQIIEVGQPQMYLNTWQEQWIRGCGCSSGPDREIVNCKQTLIQIVKNKAANLKEGGNQTQIPKCSQCGSKLKNQGKKNSHYLNCQKVKINVSMTTGLSKEEIFHSGTFQMYMDQSNLGKLKLNEVVDLCCYFSAEPRLTRSLSSGVSTIKIATGIYLICSYKPTCLSSSNNYFFSKISTLTIDQSRCLDPRDSQTILTNYNSLMDVINKIKFPYLPPNTLTTLKLVVLASLFSQQRYTKLHILVMTDEVDMISKMLQIGQLKIRRWPSIYDDATLMNYLLSCHNCILMIHNPTKKDILHINCILKEEILVNVNIALWIIAQPSKQMALALEMDAIQVVIDLSMEKNLNVCRSAYEEMVDHKLASFIRQCQEEDYLSMTIPKKKTKSRIYDCDNYHEVFQLETPISEEDKIKEEELALSILQRYYLRARQYKKVKSVSLSNLRKVTNGLASFRHFINQKGKVDVYRSHPYVSLLDVLLAIFLQEESCRNRPDSGNTLFASEVSKLMLNEGNCQLSFWEYDLDQNAEIGESKRYITKGEMFKRMVCKVITLIYDHQID